MESAISGPSATASESNPEAEAQRPATQPASTLDIPESQGGKKRGSSPGRRFKNAFSSDKKEADSARERSSSASSKRSVTLFGGTGRRGSLSAKRAQSFVTEPPPPLPPIRTDIMQDKPSEPEERPAPKTPPHTAVPAPRTTVTPPTPAESRLEFPKLSSPPNMTQSPEAMNPKESVTGVVVSPSGNMISHRRVRSASSAHMPSKLSSSMTVGPTLDEVKNGSRTPSATQTGFFSSVFSVAQNAASTLSSSLNTQPKGRGTGQVDGADMGELLEGDEDAAETQGQENNQNGENKGEDKKPRAIETLGTGNLDFSQLEADVPPGGSISTPDGIVITKPDLPPEKRKNNVLYQRDEESARREDKSAARAVYMAYEKRPGATPVASAEEPLAIQSSTSLPKDFGAEQLPASGDILDADAGTRLKRSPSMRSRLARRHRGSSGATTSTVGAIGAGAVALGLPGVNSSLPRLTGFAVASKKRNREFHQLFRSVPEDDYLIEDYSCALQREIILAGRIYVSEGHICFSSNILGWVTTLVISFDEVVAIEKESTAMVFPNAIAIQTLHARHMFRSLLSREATYDLMVNIWKINHPALKSSINGTRVSHGTGDKTEKAGESDVESVDDDDDEEDEIYDEDEEGETDSLVDAVGASVNGSEPSMPSKPLSRQVSGNVPTLGGAAAGADGEAKGDKGGDMEFPGPLTHPPTEYTDPNGQYEKVVKDEIIPAPLGKVYSLVFGPASGAFVPKFLVDNQKSGELQFSSEKKGLTNDSRNREYSYIKPLNGSIGPKQTKCISTEYLDFLDLEKAVLVTLTTQTPDVPSGNVFSTKTKYLFTWAANNQTRFFMTCTVEWTGKSWLKGPIEKGSLDGQIAFGTDLVQAIKAALAPRARAAKTGGKGKGKRKKGDLAGQDESPAAAKSAAAPPAGQSQLSGILEPIGALFEPIVGILKPLLSGNAAFVIAGVLVLLIFFRGTGRQTSLSDDIGCPGYTLPQRLAAYEEMWRREESELWSWLEDRVGIDGTVFPVVSRPPQSPLRQKVQQLRHDRDLSAKMSEDKMSDREMDAAIQTTRERLDALEGILNKRKSPVVEEVQSRHEL